MSNIQTIFSAALGACGILGFTIPPIAAIFGNIEPNLYNGFWVLIVSAIGYIIFFNRHKMAKILFD